MLKRKLESIITSFWYCKKYFCRILAYFLSPFSLIYILVCKTRYFIYRHLKHLNEIPVPVIVVGNITVGGTGKTPLVIFLAETLKAKGYRPGIILRGYGGKQIAEPVLVTNSSKAEEVGDEALLLARRTYAPVAVFVKRPLAALKLINEHKVNIIISDDGLQHYALKRDIEIAVLDGERLWGNGLRLPAGPLRESKKRLFDVDFVVINGNQSQTNSLISALKNKIFYMHSRITKIYNLKFPQENKKVEEFLNSEVHAVAAIGNPKRFFNTLNERGIKLIAHPFPDHHSFSITDLAFNDSLPILMTEKDAVKCSSFTHGNFWAVEIASELNNSFIDALLEKLQN